LHVTKQHYDSAVPPAVPQIGTPQKQLHPNGCHSSSSSSFCRTKTSTPPRIFYRERPCFGDSQLHILNTFKPLFRFSFAINASACRDLRFFTAIAQREAGQIRQNSGRVIRANRAVRAGNTQPRIKTASGQKPLTRGSLPHHNCQKQQKRKRSAQVIRQQGMANAMPARCRKQGPGKSPKDGTDQKSNNHDPSKRRDGRNPRLHEKWKQCQRKLDTIAINAH
jgi:hypothetical protein